MFLCQEAAPPPPCLSERKRLWPSPPVNDDDWAAERQLRWFLLGFNNYQTERKPQRHSVFDWQRRAPPLSPHGPQIWNKPRILKRASLFWLDPSQHLQRRVSRWGGIMGLRPMAEKLLHLATWRWLSRPDDFDCDRRGLATENNYKRSSHFLNFFCNSPFYLQMLSMAQNKGQCFRSAMLLYKSGGHCNGWNVPSACKLWSIMST